MYLLKIISRFDFQLEGVVAPNDEVCHLNANGDYTHSSIQNYPNVSQINSKVLQNAISVIFAVTPEQNDVYINLSRDIEGSNTATLSDDSSNVVELVKEHYSVSNLSVLSLNYSYF